MNVMPQGMTRSFNTGIHPSFNAGIHPNVANPNFRVAPRSQAVTRTIPNAGFRSLPPIASRNRVVTTDPRRVGTARTIQGRNLRFAGPPADISRNWGRDLEHTWNHHRWCWRNGAWVSLGAAPYYYDYGPYYYGSDSYGPDTYGSDYSGSDYVAPDYSYDSAAPSAASAPYAASANSVSIAAEVQRKLLLEGYDGGPIDGVMGTQTRNAISAFQRDHNLDVTGDINSPLLEALGLL
jgi:hypothetical protein